MAIDVFEVMEAEQLLSDIESNSRHPVNDKTHPSHRASRKAFLELEGKVIAARAMLEIEELFKLGKKNKLAGVTK